MLDNISHNKVRIIVHNCARSPNSMQGVLESAVHSADIILIQEPHSRIGSNPVSHPSFTLYTPPSLPNHPIRTVAYVRKNHPSLVITPRPDICNDPDVQVLQIQTAAIPTTTLFNIYNQRLPRSFHPRLRTDAHTLSNIQFPPRSILAGDFNAHHPWWNSTAPPKDAEILVSVLQVM